MKKLIAMLSVCAGAMGLHAAATGTSFEVALPEDVVSTNYVDLFETEGIELSGVPGSYWNVTAGTVDTFVDEFLVTTNNEGTTAYTGPLPRHSAFSTSANSGFLAIATKKDKSVTRYANADKTAVDISRSYYFDSLVKFTAFETNKAAEVALADGGKMAIWIQSELNDELEPTNHTLVVSAGYLSGSSSYTTAPTNYYCQVSDEVNVFDDNWHRVTVKAFDSIYDGATVPGFIISIDNYPVVATNEDRRAGIDTGKLSARAKAYDETYPYVLFPSANINEATISSVSFQGVGAVDDVVFADYTDREWLSDDDFTIKLGSHVTSAEYSVDGGAAVAITGDTSIPYSANMELTIDNIVYAAGYMKLGCGPTVSGVSIVTNDASYVVTVSAAKKSVTIDAQAIGATIVDSSGTPVVTPCATAADAFLAICRGEAGIGPYTVTLSADATEGIELLGYNEVTLDLAGNSIYAGEKSAAISVGEGISVGVSLTIVDSVGGGKVIGDSDDGVAAVLVDCGTLTIGGGTYEGLVNADPDPDGGNVFTVTGAGVKFTKADVDDNETYAYTLAAVVAGLGAGYELAEGTGGDAGYYIVRETPTTATVTFDLNGGEGSIAPVVVDINDTVAEPSPAPTKTGYTFDCWKLNDAEFYFDTPITADITLVAAWTINSYDVTYNLDLVGATNVAGNITSYTVETEAFPLLPAGCENYNFLGWTNSVGETVSEIAGGRTGDVTLYAKWEAAGGGFPGGDGATFDIDTATQEAIEAKLPAGKALTDVADAASGMTYAQAYALDLLDISGVEAEVSALKASIELLADDKVEVTLANAPKSAYTVTLKVYSRTSLTSGDWSADPVKTFVYGEEVAIDKDTSVDAEFYKVTVSISNATP